MYVFTQTSILVRKILQKKLKNFKKSVDIKTALC